MTQERTPRYSAEQFTKCVETIVSAHPTLVGSIARTRPGR